MTAKLAVGVIRKEINTATLLAGFGLQNIWRVVLARIACFRSKLLGSSGSNCPDYQTYYPVYLFKHICARNWLDIVLIESEKMRVVKTFKTVAVRLIIHWKPTFPSKLSTCPSKQVQFHAPFIAANR